jgi:hypothetical protein
MKGILAGLVIGAVAWFTFAVTAWFDTSAMLGLDQLEGKLVGLFFVLGIWIGTLWDQINTLATAHDQLVDRVIELETRLGGRVDRDSW